MLFLSIEGYWRNLLMFLCEPIYKLIVILYELFEVIGTADILSSDILSVLYSRIGSLLGVYMMFRIIFSCIQMLINPDYVSDKEKGFGKIIFKVFMTILLLAVTPFIFEKAFELQNYIVGVNGEGNVIAKIVLPNQDSEAYKDFGPQLSAYVFTNFYRYTDDVPEGEKTCALFDENGEAGINSSLHKAIITTRGNVKSAKICLDDSWEVGNQENYAISFTSNGLFAVIIGLVICYVLLMYTLMVGARVIQLAFLRIISPMAILGYLSPKKDGMFEKWLKMCTTTYLDLFIRMAIIYFVVFMISLIIGNYNGIALAKDYDQMWIVNIVMILALLLFAKKAPELLKELFPKSGVASLGFGVKSPKGLFNDMLFGSTLSKGYDKAIGFTKNAPKRAVGMLSGAVIGGAIGAIGASKGHKIGSFLGGTGRGLVTGMKKGGWKNVAEKQKGINEKYRNLHDVDGDYRDVMQSKFRSAIGMQTIGQINEQTMSTYDNIMKTQKAMKDYAEGEMIKTGAMHAYQAKIDVLKSISIDRDKYNIIDPATGNITGFDDAAYQAAKTSHESELAAALEEFEKKKKQFTNEWMDNNIGSNQVLKAYDKELESYSKDAGFTYDRTDKTINLSDRSKTVKDLAEEAQADLRVDSDYKIQKAADEAAGGKK